MSFNPNLPANNSPISSAELRGQFNGLLELIADTSGSVMAVENLSLSVSNPPTQAEVQTIADKINEMLDAMKRS